MDKILIIEDSRAQAEYLKSILTADYEVTICLSGEDGFRKAKGEAFSLIFLDIIMPDVDGFSLLRRFQETALTRHTPVILVSGLADVQHEEKGLTLGAVDYITKPFSPITVRARASIHIKLHHYQMQFMQMATIDQLTGVANRRRYEDESILKWREATRLGLTFSVCMFDIDKFKMYNDMFGHPAGDQVIAGVAKTASAFFQRSTDLFARYGGEEFVAVFVGSDAQPAYEFMKSVRQAVEDLHIPHDPSVSPWVTISVGGVTLLPKDGDSYEDYLKVADNMLYKAKHNGRNMVVWSDAGKEEWQERPPHSPAVQA